ncbi:MAG: TetR family transcriptional regulator [Deltaproteobacteria bacterium]|nr:TetR family transcriptional regulator [Deltaproteobacteria bacterium]
MTAIIEAAEIEFSQKGFAGTSLQSIADRAALTKWQIIYFFKTKENLYKEIINQIFSEMGSINTFFHEGKPSEVISKYIEYLFKLVKVNPHRSKLLVNEMTQGAEFALPILHERRSNKDVNLSVKHFEQWIAEKKLITIDPLMFMFLLWSAQHFFVVFQPEVAFLMGREKLDDDDWAHIVTELKTIFLSVFKSNSKK